MLFPIEMGTSNHMLFVATDSVSLLVSQIYGKICHLREISTRFPGKDESSGLLD